jgi:hypothetical protein
LQLNKEDILGASETYLITSKGIFFRESRATDTTFAQQNLIAYNNTFVVTTKGI